MALPVAKKKILIICSLNGLDLRPRYSDIGEPAASPFNPQNPQGEQTKTAKQPDEQTKVNAATARRYGWFP